jgi:DNA-binding CsgD family transcriptional regulator
MEHFENLNNTQQMNDDFWERMRLLANIPCLVSGLFCAEQKTLQAITVSSEPDCGVDAPKQLTRHLIMRMSAFATIQSGSVQQGDATCGNAGSDQYPIWLRLNTVVVGIGRPLNALYPVVAFGEPPSAQSANVQDLLGLGLIHTEYSLTRSGDVAPKWPEGLAEATLRLLSIGLFVVDARSNILHDQSGEHRTRDSVWITSRARLSVKSEPERLALQAAIAEATSDKRQASITSVTSEAGRMQMVAVAPLQKGDQALALVLFELRQTDHRALREHFFRFHQLTRSEGLIAREVLDGRAPAEIAEMTGMSVGTVRGYLKQVFAKTGTHRQSELVSHYYASILPIGINIARADLRAGSARRRSGATPRVLESRMS